MGALPELLRSHSSNTYAALVAFDAAERAVGPEAEELALPGLWIGLILWITLRVRIGTGPAGGADMVTMFVTCSS